ncbi:helix-turn-helix domain-containing protein [Nocardia vinacea]|uniref:helix-turn-helix domain-containing protein n=1 Tax=Nocardia vinacea TaxID=96468 RepID=UPI00059256A5|nr:helix-turn-helix domain-containing protein [Nocardia vinacea]
MTASRRQNLGPKAAAGNRAALIRAARTVFAENGFDAPLSLIARAAGVGQGVLYRHFPTRESMALAVFEENIVELEVLAADPATTVGDVLALIVDQLNASAAFIAMIYPSNTEDEQLLGAAWRLLGLIAQKLDDPRQRGDIRADVTAMDVVLAVAMLAALLAKTAPESRQATSRQAWAILERGLRA